VLVADAGGAPLREPSGGSAVVAIGPEGGFAPPEISLFEEDSSLFFSLGSRILRLETAVVVALARLVDPG
jgi:16S rRNA (uracil1498-N3)-methyltransferase